MERFEGREEVQKNTGELGQIRFPMRETDQSGGGGERLMRMTSTEGKDNQEITGGAE